MSIDFSGLTNRKNIGSFLNRQNLVGFGLEIGVAYGENAEAILKEWNGIGLFLVDPWNRDKCGEYIDGSASIDFDGAFGYCVNKLSQFPCRSMILRMTSDEALDFIPDSMLDFCYIDGNHHNPQFEKDLTQWYKKVKKGGVLGGHDYYDLNTPEYKCDVKSTVDKYAIQRKLKVHITNSEPLDFSWWFEVV